jgi:hypothetical protein
LKVAGELIRVSPVCIKTRQLLILTVPLPEVATDKKQFALLEEWLQSYKPNELFDTSLTSDASVAYNGASKASGLVSDVALRIIPTDHRRRMGMVEVSPR